MDARRAASAFSARTSATARRGALVALALLAGACAKPFDPFQIPDAEVRERVETIALFPLRVAPDVGDRELLAPRIAALLEERLGAGGFRVVPTSTTEALWRKHASAVGPIFDARTGAADEERRKAVREAVVRELARAHGVDAVLDVWIAPLALYLPRNETRVCGAELRLYWPPGEPRRNATTAANAACLYVQLRDLENRLLYGIRSGLEVYETYAEQTRAQRPLEERFAAPQQLREVVDDALGPLAERAGHAGRDAR